MYYATFMLFDSAFAHRKLTALLRYLPAKPWLIRDGNYTCIDSLEDVLAGDYVNQPPRFSSFWCLTSSKEDVSAAIAAYDFRIRPGIYPPESVDTFLEEVAADTAWAVLMWGGEDDCLLFGLISSDRDVRDRFVEATDNTSVIQGVGPPEGMLVSDYEVTQRFWNACKGLLFFERAPGAVVWDKLGRTGSAPVVVFPRIEGFEGWRGTGATLESPLKADCDCLGYIGEYFEGRRMYMYRPRDRQSLECLCELWYQGYPCVVLPGDVAHSDAQSVTHMADNAGMTGLLLPMMRGFLDIVEWVMFPGMGHIDLSYLLLFARDSNVIKQVMKDRDSYEVEVVSCF